MEKNNLTIEELNNIPKEAIILMYMQISSSFESLAAQNEQLIKQVAALQENVAVLMQRKFGRSTERISAIPGQLSFEMDDLNILNEIEKLSEEPADEPEIETVIVRKKKAKGKREEDLKGIDVEPKYHILSEDTLNDRFPYGYDRLPDEVYKELEYIPAKFVVYEHHIAIYAGKRNTGIVRADSPDRLLDASLLTPSLASSVFNAKYVNAMPINRISEEFLRNDINISKQVMAGWMIRISERYLGPVYREMHKKILESKLIHCDETPFKVLEICKERQAPNAKSFMWVYHTYQRYGSPPIFLYEYQPGRSSDMPRDFLGDYKGILMTDGFQVYHKLANERPDKLRVAGCWTHAKRYFTEIAKSVNNKTTNGVVAAEAIKRITAIYHVDNMCKDASDEERLEHRKTSVKPLVDAFFVWLKPLHNQVSMDKGSNTYRAITYCINQEKYLREFLNDGMIPLDNNDAERSIRSFCVGKHSWHIISSKNGAQASAILYSIAETAKANGLKPFEYFKYLLEQILLHQDDALDTYIPNIVPWSEKIPDYCRKQKNR